MFDDIKTVNAEIGRLQRRQNEISREIEEHKRHVKNDLIKLNGTYYFVEVRENKPHIVRHSLTCDGIDRFFYTEYSGTHGRDEDRIYVKLPIFKTREEAVAHVAELAKAWNEVK